MVLVYNRLWPWLHLVDTVNGKGDRFRKVDKDKFNANYDKIFGAKNVCDQSLMRTQKEREMSNFDKVGQFMSIFGQKVLTTPQLPGTDLAVLRLDLIEEEVEELGDGIDRDNMLEIADALTDILYVVYGAGHAFGIDLDACFNEVHRSNMTKLHKGKPIYREDGKILKGEGYEEPNLEQFV